MNVSKYNFVARPVLASKSARQVISHKQNENAQTDQEMDKIALTVNQESIEVISSDGSTIGGDNGSSMAVSPKGNVQEAHFEQSMFTSPEEEDVAEIR